MDDVPGWFYPADRVLFQAISATQRSAGIRGDILEIGCFRGKSAILLGFEKQESERLYVCDLFGDDPGTELQKRENELYYSNFSRSQFEENYKRFHATLPEILHAPSTDLTLPPGTFRFIHVDGSHQWEIVKKDIDTVLKLAAPGAVLVFDDYLQFHVPGVPAAVWGAVDAGKLIPVVLSPNKLYAVKEASLASAFIRACSSLPGMFSEMESIAGHPCIRVRVALKKQGLAKKIYWVMKEHFA